MYYKNSNSLKYLLEITLYGSFITNKLEKGYIFLLKWITPTKTNY